MRPQRFDTEYWTWAGVFVIYAETYFVLVRMSDGLSTKITYESIGL